jgi:RecB family endonuclease NucS
MAARPHGRKLVVCQADRHRDRRDRPRAADQTEWTPPMQTVKTTTQFARYLLTSLVTAAFGMNLN